MSGRVCSHCGCGEIEEDAARGDAVCTSCGSVLEENVIVSEVQFAETAQGGHMSVGHFMAADGTTKTTIGTLQGYSQDSRAATYLKAKRRISTVASQLRLNQRCQDMAFNFFKNALSRGLTKGRPSSHTIAACLYMTCRLEGTQHLLLDFSDALRVNVYELGKVFTFLCRSLYLNLPPTDPCSYIIRFAHALKFGEKEQEVANLAMRVVQRMKRDWIGIGRRPTGLCGAALILAARYFNFNRTIQEVVEVVQIGPGVLKNRLDEFARTASSALTLDEFQSVDLEDEADPPAYTVNRIKDKKKKDEEIAEKIAPQVTLMENEVYSAIENALSRKHKRHNSVNVTGAKTPSRKRTISCVSTVSGADDVFGELGQDELQECSSFIQHELLEEVLTSEGVPAPPPIDEETPADRYRLFAPTLATFGLDDDAPSTSQDTPNIGIPDDSGELLTSDLDDDEIEGYILAPDEVAHKTKVWMLANDQVLKDMEVKRLRREEEAAKKAQGGGPKRKRRRWKGEAATPGEAIEKIVQEKKLSNKINYDVLKNLTDFKVTDPSKIRALQETGLFAAPKVEPALPPAQMKEEAFSVPSTPIRIRDETVDDPVSAADLFRTEFGSQDEDDF